MRKKEIQLKKIIQFLKKNDEIEAQYFDLYVSPFYQNLKGINSIEEISNIPDLNKFILDYEDYIKQIEKIHKVRFENSFLYIILRNNTFFFIEIRVRNE